MKKSERGTTLSTNPYEDTYGDVDYSVGYEEGKVVFTVDTPSGLIESDHTNNIAFEFDSDADGTPDWQIKYQPNSGEFSGDYDWGYSANDGSTWTAFQDASDVVEVDRTGGTFEVKVDASKLGGFGSDYKYGFEIWNQNLESGMGEGEGVPQFVKIELPSPDGFSWTDMSDYPTRTIGAKITNPVTLGAGESFDFAVTNSFAIDLEPGIYEITSEVVPK